MMLKRTERQSIDPGRLHVRLKHAREGVVLATMLLTGCQSGVLDPRGPVGLAEKTILLDCLLIMLAIVVPTVTATLAFAWWFRASNKRSRYLPNWAYSGRIELITWSVPLLTITLLGGVTWIASHDLDPAKALASDTTPLEVQVVSLDWKWLFIYPAQNVASVNQLVVPVGTPIHFNLTSASVMSAFFVPQLGSMIYTMNGMATQLNLQASEPGVFHGLSSHYNGDGFSDMHFDVYAIPSDRFSAWADGARDSSPTLDQASYEQLSKQSINIKPFTYRATSPDLFQQIVNQAIRPGPGVLEGSNPGSSKRAEK